MSGVTAAPAAKEWLWEAWDGGDDALIYDHAVDGDVGEVATGTLIAGYDYRITVENYDNSIGDYKLMYLEGFKAIDAAWLRMRPIVTNGSQKGFSQAEIMVPARADNAYIYSTYRQYSLATGWDTGLTVTLTSGIDQMAVTQAITKLRWITSSGVIISGKVLLERKAI